MIRLLDCTTRDGGHTTNWDYSDEYILNLMSELNNKRICFYEIGYRNYCEKDGKGKFYYCTPDVIKKFYNHKDNLSLGVMVDTKRYNEKDFADGKNDCIDFVRIATHPDTIKKTLLIAECLNSRSYNVMIQLMDITNLSSEHYKLLDEWKSKNILKTVYLADTYGIINEETLEKIFNKIHKIGYEHIGFHAHNKTGLALNNSLKAIELGMYSIDVTQNEDGINGGNLLYKDLLKNISSENILALS